MRSRVGALLLLLTSCTCEDWKVPPKVAFRRMAAARLQSCVQENPCVYVSSCFAQSTAYCLDAGMEAECGQMEKEGTCGVNVK